MVSRTNASLSQLRENMAKRDAAHARRDKDNLRWQAELWIADIAILGILIRWPA